MTPRKAALFIALDLILLLGAILFFAYHGLSHLIMLIIGSLFFILALYDMRRGDLSALFSAYLGFPEENELKRFHWVPAVLAVLLFMVSLPTLLEHGLINSSQRWAMQEGGRFWRLAAIAASGGLLVIGLALLTLFKGSRK